MFKNPIRTTALVLVASAAIYGAAVIPAGAYQLGKDVVAAALIPTVNSLS